MKIFVRLSLILLAFCVVATALLAYVNSITEPKIKALKLQEAESARAALIPGATFEEVKIPVPRSDSLSYYIARDEKTKEIKGYTFTGAKSGYSSTVKTMAAFDPAFKLMNIKVIEQSETPGLGANCSKEDFAARFKNLELAELLVDKDGGKIASLTGATITTRAVTNSLKEAAAIIKQDVEAKLAAPKQEMVQ